MFLNLGVLGSLGSAKPVEMSPHAPGWNPKLTPKTRKQAGTLKRLPVDPKTYPCTGSIPFDLGVITCYFVGFWGHM